MCYASVSIDTQEEVIWKEIPGFSDYLISNEGDVWNEKRKNFPKVFFHSTSGSLAVHLNKSLHLIHCLVLETFVELKPNIKKTKIIVNHKDGNKFNNNVNNLEWITKFEQANKIEKDEFDSDGTQWKVINTCPNYYISSKGQIWSKYTRKIKELSTDYYGYSYVNLTKENREQKRICIHHLMWETFRGPRTRGLVVNHKDGVKSNNNLNNLELVTRAEDRQHAWDIGLHERTRIAAKINVKKMREKITKLSADEVKQIRTLYKQGIKQKELAILYNISSAHISNIVNNKFWKEGVN